MIGSLFAAAQPALQIQNLQVAPSLPPPGAGQEVTLGTLEARTGGIIGWLQGLFGTARLTTLSVTNQRIMRTDQSKNATDMVVMPIGRVSTIHNGSKKPAVGQLIVGILFALAGLPTVFLSLVGIAMIVSYFGGSSYYLMYGGVGSMMISVKVKTQDPAQLDRLCSMSWEVVKSTSSR